MSEIDWQKEFNFCMERIKHLELTIDLMAQVINDFACKCPTDDSKNVHWDCKVWCESVGLNTWWCWRDYYKNEAYKQPKGESN